MSSLRVSETETVGYGVRGDVVHDICATDHICFIDLAFVLCGEGDRRAIGVFDQQSHAAGLVVPEFLRTLVFARPRGDDQFADCTFSPSLDMSR